MSLRFDREAVKALLRDDSGLAALVHQFNAQPALYAHPSWFEGLVPQHLLNVLRTRRRSVRRLSTLLLDRHCLADEVCYDFQSRQWRLALLPVQVVQKLALYGGLAFQHRRICATVDKATLAAIKGSIGEQAYAFAVKRAPLMFRPGGAVNRRWDGRGDFGRFCRDIGAVCFLTHFYAAPRAVAERLAFKFSRAIWRLALGKMPETSWWPLFKRIVIHEIDPRWQTLLS
jgi:hypothetical protein